ncbi:MAG: regulatory signaling modulator protein AmpE [Gammaproteobacteria bacterium]
MTLISVLVALLVERFLGHLQDLRRFDAFVDFSGRLRRRFFQSPPWDGAFGVLVVLAVPVVITAVLQDWLSSWLFGLPELVFSIAVLVYCLGPRDLAADAESYQDAAGGADESLVYRAADRLLGGQLPDSGDREGAAVDGVFSQSNTRLFAVLFWFMVLGPMGAVLYRCATVLRQQGAPDESEFQNVAVRFHSLLGWPSAWLAGLGFAVSGDFEGALTGLREGRTTRLERFFDPTAGVLVDAGRGALGLEADSPVDASTVGLAMGVVWRTLGVWVFLLALFTLAGWAA